MVDWKRKIALELKSEAAVLPPNSRFHPIRKLMSRFGTSQRTIEQVMGELVAANVVVRRPGDGYFVRDFSAKRQLHYRLLYPKWPSEHFKELEGRWRDYAEQSGTIRFSSRTVERSDEFYHSFPIDDCDAVMVIAPAGPISRAGLSYICSLPVPVVILEHEVADVGLSMVSGSAGSGGAMAAAHLINHGHRRLAMLVNEPHCDGLDMRCQAFIDFSFLHGVSVEVIDLGALSWENSEHRAYDLMNDYLDRRGLDFTGLFLISAHAALEVYKAFTDRGISIPDDVSIIAHDDLAASEFLHPPLDSIGMDWDGLIGQVDRELRKVISGEQPFFHIRQSPVLVKRQSTRKLIL